MPTFFQILPKYLHPPTSSNIFPNPRNYQKFALTDGVARIIFVYNFYPATLYHCVIREKEMTSLSRDSNPRQSVELLPTGTFRMLY